MKNTDCLYLSVCTNKCTDSCIRYCQMKRLLELSNLPKNQQKKVKIKGIDVDIDAFKKLDKIKSNIVNFVNNGKNLYICSKTCGNAKTSWAINIMLKYFDQTWHNSYDVTRGLFVYVPSFLLDLKKFNNVPEYVERILEADLVIWDDIGFTSTLTEYEHEQLLHFIDYRISSNKTNIYTSNITTEKELSVSVGARLSSRIFNESTVVKFEANDYRISERLAAEQEDKK